MNKLLIFDFDGTIADTKSIYYKAISDELKIFNYTDKQIDKAIDLGLSLRKTLARFGFSFLALWWLKKKIMGRVKRYAEKVKKCKDVDSIREIKGRKILISNSLKEFIMPIIKHFKLKGYFNEIYGADDFDDKAEFIKDYLNKNKIKKENCYYIGDRAADIRLAKKVRCKSIIVSGKCAWDSRKEILEENPDFVVSDLEDVRRII